MTIRLVDAGWDAELTKALGADTSELRIVCPFIKVRALDRLLSLRPGNIQVITRFNLADFAEGVSDVAALRKLLDADASVRGVRNLHAKLYLIGASRVILTSANLTEAALSNRNHEFGMVTEDTEIIATCRAYFDTLWRLSAPDLQRDQVDDWDKTITSNRASGGRSNYSAELKDLGADVRVSEPPAVHMPAVVDDEAKAFVKFIGTANKRAPLSRSTIQAIKRAGCHWAVCYPPSKRPRNVSDDDVIFIAWLTQDPNDIRVFGRAIGVRHVEGRDDATRDDIKQRDWKKKYPRYIRVHHAEFVAGTMENGVSLNELMDTLGADSFSSTQHNAEHGKGNTDPRRAYLRQPAVELSRKGLTWLRVRLQAAFDTHGKVPQDKLDKLDLPIGPSSLDVERALNQIDRDGVPLRQRSTRYCLVARKRHYPPKLVLSIASGVSVSKLHGGPPTNRPLEKLHYQIVLCGGRNHGSGEPPKAPQKNAKHRVPEERTGTIGSRRGLGPAAL